MKLLILLLVGVGLATAQVPGFGGCPDFETQPDFDMNKFLGTWYEAERYVNVFEAGTRCVKTNYTKAVDGRFLVANEIMNRFTSVKRVLEGEIRLVFKGSEAKLNVKYPNLPIPYESQFSVLETDYDQFAVMWSCSSLGIINTQNAWILTREKLPSGSTLQKAYGVLDKYKLSRTFFVKTEQSSCEIASAEPNKTPQSGAAAAAASPEPVQNDGPAAAPLAASVVPVESKKPAAGPLAASVVPVESKKPAAAPLASVVPVESKKTAAAPLDALPVAASVVTVENKKPAAASLDGLPLAASVVPVENKKPAAAPLAASAPPVESKKPSKKVTVSQKKGVQSSNTGREEGAVAAAVVTEKEPQLPVSSVKPVENDVDQKAEQTTAV